MYQLQPKMPEFPGFVRSSYGSDALLVPESLLKGIREEKEDMRCAEFAALDAEAQDPAIDVAPEVCAINSDSEPFRPATYSVEVFSESAINIAIESSKHRDRDTRDRVKETVKLLQRQKGRRWIPDIEADVIEAIATALRERFPNFCNVIDYLVAELSLAMASSPEAFRLAPLLLFGSPGVGKTAFAMAFARMLGVGFDKVSAAGTQGGFELVGTSAHWSTSGPGRVLDLLGDGEYATPVLLVDEADKMSHDTHNPITPALLELLEPVSAREFVDQSLNIHFDASKLIVIATANDISAISDPLLSRMHSIEVLAPTMEERRHIAETIFHEMVRGLVTCLEVQSNVLDRLAEAPIDIRMVGRLLRDGSGRAIRDGRDIVGIDDVHIPITKGRSRVGFV